MAVRATTVMRKHIDGWRIQWTDIYRYNSQPHGQCLLLQLWYASLEVYSGSWQDRQEQSYFVTMSRKEFAMSMSATCLLEM